MLPRIRRIEPQDGYRLLVDFDEGARVIYDVGNDIDQIPAFSNLRTVPGLFANARLDSSRTIVEWSDEIDLPSDTIFEYGQRETLPKGQTDGHIHRGEAEPRSGR